MTEKWESNLNKFLEVFNMPAKIAYVILEGITVKEGDWFDKKTGEPQVKYNLRCTGKSGATVWFNLFADVGQDNTILKGFGAGMGVKVTFLQSGDKGQFKNVVGISRAEVKVEKKSGGADQDKIMILACLKSVGPAPAEIIVAATVAQWKWDVAEDLFLKVNSRRYGGETAKPATAEMSKEESKKYEEPPQEDPSTPAREGAEPDEEIPF